ncbi:MAG: hypothetical protein ABSB01_07220 [Streptosporangiaceae bacterium]|jgi:hypothetical protein
MAFLLFFLGILLGVLVGGALCVRYIRHEVAADIGPRMRHMQLQLDNLESAINLALVTAYADFSSVKHQRRSAPGPDGSST